MPSSTEELIKIILSVDGQEGLKALEQQLKLNAEATEALKKEFAAGSVTFDEFISKSKKLAASGSELQNYHDQMQTGSKLSAQGLLKLGNTLDDLQYVGEMGLRPIINNVMQIAPAIGIAMIAVEMLRKKFGEDIADALGLFSKSVETAEDKIDRLKKKVEELEKKPYKLAIDYSDLEKANAELDDLEKREANRKAAEGSTPEKSFAGIAQKVVTDYLGGAPNLTNTLNELEKQSGFQHASEAQKDEKKLLEGRIASPTYDENGRAVFGGVDDENRLAALKIEMANASKKYVQEQIVDPFLAGDERGIKIVKNIAQQTPGAFARKGMDGLLGSDAIGMMPSTIEEHLSQQEQADKFSKANKESMAQMAENKKKQDAENQKAIKFFDDMMADEKAGTEQAESMELAKTLREEAAAKKSIEDSKKAIAAKKKQDAADAFKQGNEQAKYRGEVLNSANDIADQNPGINPQAAVRIAEEAVALHKNFGIPMAQAQMNATQALMQGFSAVQVEMQRQKQQMAIIQANINRGRIMQPSTQPIPFTN